MNNNFKDNLDNNSYFMSLPAFIQESIKQTGVNITSEEELRKCAENLMNKQQ